MPAHPLFWTYTRHLIMAAAKKVIQAPPRTDIPGVTEAGYRFLLDVAKWINKSANSEIPTYADNAAALAGGLSVGDFYATASGDVNIVV